jgi:hypothetical protein
MVLAQASDLLRKEQLALRNFRYHLPYDTDDYKAEEMKASIMYYKEVREPTKAACQHLISNFLIQNHFRPFPIQRL